MSGVKFFMLCEIYLIIDRGYSGLKRGFNGYFMQDNFLLLFFIGTHILIAYGVTALHGGLGERWVFQRQHEFLLNPLGRVV